MPQSEKKNFDKIVGKRIFLIISDGTWNYFCIPVLILSEPTACTSIFSGSVLPVVILGKGRGPELFIPESLRAENQ
jgi:hypothetical protein